MAKFKKRIFFHNMDGNLFKKKKKKKSLSLKQICHFRSKLPKYAFFGFVIFDQKPQSKTQKTWGFGLRSIIRKGPLGEE